MSLEDYKHHKVYSDSTLKSMTKEELIGVIRCLEHNWKSAEEANDRQYQMLMEKESR